MGLVGEFTRQCYFSLLTLRGYINRFLMSFTAHMVFPSMFVLSKRFWLHFLVASVQFCDTPLTVLLFNYCLFT